MVSPLYMQPTRRSIWRCSAAAPERAGDKRAPCGKMHGLTEKSPDKPIPAVALRQIRLLCASGPDRFLSPTMIVTAAHFAEAMKLSIQDWKPLEIADEHGSQPHRGTRRAPDRGPGGKTCRHRTPTYRFNHSHPLDPQGAAGAGRPGHDACLPGRFPAFRPRAVRSIRCRREACGPSAPGNVRGRQIGLLSIAAPREHRWSIATAASLLSLVTCSPRCLPFVFRQIRISTAWGTAE